MYVCMNAYMYVSKHTYTHHIDYTSKGPFIIKTNAHYIYTYIHRYILTVMLSQFQEPT